MNWIKNTVVGLIEYCGTDNLIDICNYLEIEIIEGVFSNNSFFHRDSLGNEIIYVNTDLPLPEKRRRIAHELGHAILHIELDITFCHNKLINAGKLEREADLFSMELLTHNINFDQYKFNYNDISYVASETEIAEEIIKYKISELNAL